MGEGQIAEDYPKNKFRRYVVKPEEFNITGLAKDGMAALGAHFRFGIDIEFHIGIRADDGAYVAAILDGAFSREIALELEEGFADFGIDSDFGGINCDLSAFQDGVIRDRYRQNLFSRGLRLGLEIKFCYGRL